MIWQKLASRYHDFSALMDRGSLAIEAEDLEALEAVARESARLLEEMHETWAEAAEAAGQDPAVSTAELESLRAVMQEALHRSQDNQDRIAAWKEETGGTLRTVAQGARATAGYGAARLDA
jgi:hypothetical protein